MRNNSPLTREENVLEKKWSSAAKFKIAAVKGEVTINETYKRYEAALSQVHAWRKQLLEQGAKLFANNEKTQDCNCRT